MNAKAGNGQLTSQQATDLRQQATNIETSLGCSSSAKIPTTTAINNNSDNNNLEITSSTTSSTREQQQEHALINLRNQVENISLSSVHN